MNRDILKNIEDELIKNCSDKWKWSTSIYSQCNHLEYVDIVVYNIGPFKRAYIEFSNILWEMHWDWNEYHFSTTRICNLKGDELKWVSDHYTAFERAVKWSKRAREGRDDDRNKKPVKVDEEKSLEKLQKIEMR